MIEYIKNLWNALWDKTTIDEELKSRYDEVVKELADVKASAKQVVKQSKDVVDAAKGKKRRGRKSKKDKKAVDAYKKAIDLSDKDKKKLEKTAEKFDVPSKEYVAKDIPGTIKDLEKRLKAIDKDEEKAVAKLREEKNDIALTDMTREEQIRLLNIIKERGISLREGSDSIKTYYEIAKAAYLEGLTNGLRL